MHPFFTTPTSLQTPQTPRYALRQPLRLLGATALLGLALCAAPARAQAPADHSHHHPQAAATPAAPSAVATPVWTDGEITRRDARTGKLTIRHGEITNLGMPPMTMVFGLQDPTQASALQPGDKVRFHAEEVNGALLITRIEALQPH